MGRTDSRVIELFPTLLSHEKSDTRASQIEAHSEQNSFGLWRWVVPGVASFAVFISLSIPRFAVQFTPCVEIGWRLAAEH